MSQGCHAGCRVVKLKNNVYEGDVRLSWFIKSVAGKSMSRASYV